MGLPAAPSTRICDQSASSSSATRVAMPGIDALAAVHVRREHGHGAVRSDPQIGVDGIDRVRRERARGGSHGHVKADGQAGAGGGRADQELPAARPRQVALDGQHGSGLHQPGRLVHGGADAMIGGAAANVAGEPGIDVGIARLVDLRQERDRGMICPDWQ